MNFLNIILALLALIASSYVSVDIPITETGIPITAQSLTVILIIYFLPFKESLIVIMTYLLLGILGLPVFADGKSGIAVIYGKSGGYLYGFLLSNIAMNVWHQRLKTSSWGKWWFLALATIYILISGMLHLSFYIGLQKAFLFGVLPFLLGALIKLILAFVFTLSLERVIQKKLP